MTNYRIEVRNTNMRAEWEWCVVKEETISDTETVLVEGVSPTSEEALGKAKAYVLGVCN